MRLILPTCAAAVAAVLLSSVCSRAATEMPVFQNDTSANTLTFNDTFGHQVQLGTYNSVTGSWSVSGTLTLSSPPPIGSVAPNTGAFTTLSASGLVSGAGFTALLASPSPIGSTAPSTGAFTTLSASGASTLAALSSSGVVSGVGFSNYFASPPPIGSTLASTGAFTTLSTSGIFTVTGLSTLNGAMNLSGSSGTQSTLTATNTGTATGYTTPAFNFLASEGYASFGSTNTHFGLVIQATKNVAGSTTTGSRQAMTVQQLGVGGTSTDFFTAGFELAEPCLAPVVCNGFNLGGNFTGNNPYVFIPTGMAIQSAVGEEIDNTVQGTTTVAFREGLRIVDIGSAVQGSTLDAAINVANSGLGWKNLLYAGDGTSTFGLAAGGTFIGTPATTVALASLMDFSPITGIPTKGGIVLGPNVGQNICWGLTSACLGGQISSQTTAGGMSIVFINGFTGIGSGTLYFYVTAAGQLLHTPKTFAQLPTCNAGAKGEQDEISDQTVALGFNTVANGGGAISAAVRCDGTSWKDF